VTSFFSGGSLCYLGSMAGYPMKSASRHPEMVRLCATPPSFRGSWPLNLLGASLESDLTCADIASISNSPIDPTPLSCARNVAKRPISLTTRRWRHLDHGDYPTWLHAHVPRVVCPEHGIRRSASPGHCPPPALPSPSSGMPSMCSGRPTSREPRACSTSVGTRPGTSWSGRWRAGCGPSGAASSPTWASTRRRWPGDIATSRWSATWIGPRWSTLATTGGRPARTPTTCPSPGGI
jgi:zinc-finger of transposase IS204/IS1001/IS1096/IS1165